MLFEAQIRHQEGSTRIAEAHADLCYRVVVNTCKGEVRTAEPIPGDRGLLSDATDALGSQHDRSYHRTSPSCPKTYRLEVR